VNKKMNNEDNYGRSTKCVHVGTEPDPTWGSVVTPIHQTTTYAVPNVMDLIARYGHKKEGYTYTSTGNPTQRSAEIKIAALEGGEDAAVFSAGMAAITSTITSLVSKGDEIITQQDLYGETFHFFHRLESHMGVKTRFFETTKIEEMKALINDKTKIIYLETPTNPTLKLVDIDKAAKMAKEHHLITVIDNTFASPLNQTPLAIGVNVVVESATKSLSGHHHVVCGAAVSNKEMIKKIKGTRSIYGQTLDPFGAFLLITGMQTMALRIDRQNFNAQRLAEFLEAHSKITIVHYPGLSSHPQHKLAEKQMHGFGGMLSFEVDGDLKEITKMFDHLKLVKLATSLGGVDTIATIPSISTHGGLSKEEQEKMGVTQSLVRVSVGIEDFEDLRKDFENALSFV
jgi:cystathionine beta-lyase/cystathionine gamma-synthase